jgi:oxygen-independent coproporphyrinogen-3 oxidase
VIDAVTWARRAGFDNLNLDLIFGLPEQSLERWSASLKRAVDLHPQHLSLYALTVEHGTPFGRWANHGLLPLPDPDAVAEMYDWAGEYLETHGYGQYEISNWSQPGRACAHNLTYWRGNPYLGFGAGAHGYANELRVSNVLRIKTYIERLFDTGPRIPDQEFPITPATVNQQHISSKTAMQETMMTGLRLTDEGVSSRDFAARYGVALTDVFGKEIDELIRLGLLEWVPGETSAVVRLTRRGRLLGNLVFMRFVE